MMTTIWSGLSVGALYAIGGLLFTLPLVRTGILNFAQPFLVILGGYVAVELVGHGWPIVAVLAALLALGALVGGLQEILTVRPTGGRHDSALVVTLGMGIAIEGFILATWGPNPLSLEFFGGDEPFSLLGGKLEPVDLWMIGVAIAAAVALEYAVGRTRWGMVGRAAMFDQTAAKLRGIDIPRMRTVTFAFGGALACAAALIAAPKTGITYGGGLHLAVFAFAALAIGGMGSFTGTLVGGLFVGLVEAFAARYLGVDWVSVLIFGILCTVLVIRPQGVFGRRELRTV
jgi:branched-chain amino acid transport system permease protein